MKSKQIAGTAEAIAVSAVIPRHAWQRGINIESVNPGGIGGRIIPYIAANSDWDAFPAGTHLSGWR